MSGCPSSSSGSEDEDEGIDSYCKGGYHAVRIGDTFAVGRYVAQKKLGWGQFSTVWLAYDTQSSIDCVNKHSLLLDVVQALTDLNLTISKGYISSDAGWFMDVFHVKNELQRN